jgi:hypothetical protein
MPFNTAIIRGGQPTHSTEPGAHPLIPEDVRKEVIKAPVKKGSKRK